MSNKSNKFNTRIKYTYNLYKYNIGRDYHHIRNRHGERHTKTKKSNNKSSDCNTRFDDTYHLYKYNIGINFIITTGKKWTEPYKKDKLYY